MADTTKKVKQTKPMIPPDALENKCSEVGGFWTVDKPLKEKSRKLLESLVRKYDDALLERLVVPRAIKTLQIAKDYVLPDYVTDEVNGISLRCLEWLVTNYSKKYKIVLYDNESKKRIDIYDEYSEQLDHHRRRRFDPFCRYQRIYFSWNLTNRTTKTKEEVVLLTTVGQMNFMRWADRKGILKYARNHQDKIQRDMEITLAEVNKEKKRFKKLGKKRKRKELSHAPQTYCTVYPVDTVLYFDHQFDTPPGSPEPSRHSVHSPHSANSSHSPPPSILSLSPPADPIPSPPIKRIKCE